MSRQTVNALERADTTPAFPLARVFSTTIEDLFNPNDEDLGTTTKASVTQS